MTMRQDLKVSSSCAGNVSEPEARISVSLLINCLGGAALRDCEKNPEHAKTMGLKLFSEHTHTKIFYNYIDTLIKTSLL